MPALGDHGFDNIVTDMRVRLRLRGQKSVGYRKCVFVYVCVCVCVCVTGYFHRPWPILQEELHCSWL